MRNADTILGVIRERGRHRLPLENISRQLYNRNLYLQAYGRLYRNDGAMTPGATTESVDAMALTKIGPIMDALRHEYYRWTPVRRVYIEKKHSAKKRPLGLPMGCAYCPSVNERSESRTHLCGGGPGGYGCAVRPARLVLPHATRDRPGCPGSRE
jgi:hypothetical protein